MRRLMVALILCAAAGGAHADNAARADQLFKKGKRLLVQKKYAEACTAFEDSDRLDPGIGAKLNVARCYQDWGKLATAWRWYVDAETMATSARDERARRIHALVEELDPSVPRLTVKVPPDADLAGVVVKLDGVVLQASSLGVEQRVDPGPHEIETIIAGVKSTQVVPVERGDTAEVVLDLATVARTREPVKAASPAPAAPGPASATVAVASDPGRTRRLVGLGVSGAGAIAIAVAGVVTLSARGDYRDALKTHCQGATDRCNERGLSITHDARHRANIATVVALSGLAAVAGGVYVYITAPRAPRSEHALYLAPSLSSEGGTLVLGGAF